MCSVLIESTDHCQLNLMCFKRIKYCSIEYLASKIKCEILYLHNIKKLAC